MNRPRLFDPENFANFAHLINMSTLDIIIVIIFAASIFFGFKRGIIAQLGSVGGILVGIVACHLFGDTLADVVSAQLGNNSPTARYVDSVMANVLIFIVGYLATRLVAKLLHTVAHAAFLGVIDRTAGALFSLFAWFLVFSILLNVWQVVTPNSDISAHSKISDGKAAKAIIDLAPRVFGGQTASQLFASDGC